MRFKNIILSSLLLGTSLCAVAQEEQKIENVFNPHWYVQAQVGGQYTLGEVSFTDLLSPNAQLGVGYNINPVLGLRLGVNAWQSKAGWDEGLDRTWKWNYVAPSLDVTANLSNLFCKYNPNRILNVGIFAGVGANVAFGNDEAADANAAILGLHDYPAGYQPLTYLWDGSKVRFQGRAGITADFRLSDRVSLGLELQASTLSDKYNSKRAYNTDWYFNGLVGVKINLGKTHTQKVIPPVAPVEKIVEKVVEKIVEKPVPQAVKAEPLRRDIFFQINNTKISVTEMQKVREIADYLKQNPNATVEITGYADKGTGNEKINEKLATNRAKAVVDVLVNELGVNANRIKSDSKGDKVQPFAEGVLNRVSICIAK